MTRAGHPSTGLNTAGEEDTDHASTSAVQADGHQPASQASPGSSHLARQDSGRHASTSSDTTKPSQHQNRGSNGAEDPGLQSSAQGVSQAAGAATHPQESTDHEPALVSATNGAAERQQNSDGASSSNSTYGQSDRQPASTLHQPQNSAVSGDEQVDISRTHSLQQPLAVAASSSSNNKNGSSPGSSQQLPQCKGQPGQYQSDGDKVAGVLHEETDANGRQVQTKNPNCWDGRDALQALCASPSVSASAWSERLQLSNGFVPVSEAEEEALVLAVGMSGDYMLSLFRAYAPHDVLTFMHFARRHCLKATSVC